MQPVSDHYTHGNLQAALMEALAAAGKNLDRLTIDDLAPVDEFHVGGREATQDLASQMELRPGLQILDVGSGLGGPARFFAQRYDCTLTGIDLTEEYVRVAQDLTARVGLTKQARFCAAGATALPFPAATFDRVYMIHVGMNIADKTGAFTEVRRVLKPEGLFAIYDVVRDGIGDVAYPVPWASSSTISFLAPLPAYRDNLKAAGFKIILERERRSFAIEFFQRARASGLRPVMGRTAAEKVANVANGIANGIIVPIEILARNSAL